MNDDGFDKWVKAILTVIVFGILWALFMLSLATFRWLGVI